MNVAGLHLPVGVLAVSGVCSLNATTTTVTVETWLGERLRQRRGDRRRAIDLNFGRDQLLRAVLLADPPAAVRPAIENARREGGYWRCMGDA